MCLLISGLTPIKAEEIKEREEVISLRDENAKIYQKADGSMQAEVYAASIHYTDGSGQLQEISNRIVSDDVEVNGSSYRYRNEANNITVRMAEDTAKTEFPVMMTWEDTSVYWGFVGNDSQAVTGYSIPKVMECLTDPEAAVVYPEVQPNVDYLYEATGTGIKENLIIKDRTETAAFEFIIYAEGCHLEETDNGAVLVNSGENRVMDIGRFYVYDSAEKGTQNVRCTVDEYDDGQYKLTITVDPEWLNAPERVFPVIVDPSTTVSGYSYTYDACICSKYPSTNYGADTNLRSGYDTDYWARRSLLRFYFNSSVSSISASSVTSATLKLYKHGGVAPQMYAHRVNTSWDSGTVNWNNRPYFSDGAISTQSYNSVGNWYSMTMTSIVQSWLNGTQPNYGVELIDDHESNTSGNYWSTFYSSEASSSYVPVLTINYDDGSSGGANHMAVLVGPNQSGHDHLSPLNASVSELVDNGYPTIVYASSVTVNNCLTYMISGSVKLIAFRCHGSYNSSSTWVTLPDGNLTSSSVANYSTSNLYAALYVSDYSGYGGIGGNNLPTITVQKGATCSVGFMGIIDCSKANEWLEAFFTATMSDDGSNVYEACGSLASLPKYSSSGLPNYIIAGNKYTSL